MRASRSLDVLEARISSQPGTTGAGRARSSVTVVLVTLALLATACGRSGDPAPAASPGDEVFTIGAIPDQDPAVLQRRYRTVADFLAEELGVAVEYVPVADYAAAVSLFRAGDLDMVWFGGLTGVQARLQVDGAEAIVQRSIDENFHSVFIAGTASGIGPIEDVAGLAALAGTRFTYGSESSTSGRLMPQFFLEEAGVGPGDFDGPPGFSGAHDTTIELVEAGTYETGVLNEQVWMSRMEAGEVDLDKVGVVFRTPAYHDYHWVIRPDVAERFGEDFVADVTAAFVELDPADPADAEILQLFEAEAFIETDNANYGQIEEIARSLDLVNGDG